MIYKNSYGLYQLLQAKNFNFVLENFLHLTHSQAGSIRLQMSWFARDNENT